ncbi:hypothetical protein [uncultured Rikenella sp.]|uniref:hypothetical protein n=1 Tax=uncultured Rikenella sp. TaxID=368003 RepID=UPI002605932D|nr:hypothetical protein [uncultured Rikenella sp.]
MPLGINGKTKPAPGLRGRTSGKLDGSVGNEGSVWSASANDEYWIYLHFYMTILNPKGSLNRAAGFPLRCLSE